MKIAGLFVLSASYGALVLLVLAAIGLGVPLTVFLLAAIAIGTFAVTGAVLSAGGRITETLRSAGVTPTDEGAPRRFPHRDRAA